MPIYEYRCQNGHTFEETQRMTDDPLTSCTSCAAPVERVFHPVAVHFKGSGFYTTDYGRGKSSASESSSPPADAKKDSPPDSKPKTKKDSSASGSD